MLSNFYLTCKKMRNKLATGLKGIQVIKRSHSRDVEYCMLNEAFSFNSSHVQDNNPIEIKEDTTQENNHYEIINDVSTFLCEICLDQKSLNNLFRVKGCAHFYCSQCIIHYVVSKLQQNILHINCPVMQCDGVLEPEHCKPILPVEEVDRWGYSLCESMITQKLYCPFYDCSALLACDCGEGRIGEQCKCPYCKRLFCAKCKVPWHSGTDCKKFQKLNKQNRGREDVMVKDLAKRKRWKRCPRCKFYVEKSQGCMHMICRCGFDFCYKCGAPSRSIVHRYCKAKQFCFNLCICFR